MNLIEVIPLIRLKAPETLSYFTSSETPVGAIVSVPLRSKTIQGIVCENRLVSDVKSEIKNASYEIRKAGKIKTNYFFPLSFMKTCAELGDYYAVNAGTIISAIVSDTLLENANKIAPPLDKKRDIRELSSPLVKTAEIYGVQGNGEDRMSSWRSLIRQEFAKKKSLAFYAPTIEYVEALFATLEKGIEGYIFELHGNVSDKKIVEVWNKIATIEHPVVIVATGSFSVFPRSDVETVVIERENDRGWKSLKTPYVDFRKVIESLATNQNKTLFLSDCMLRVETLHRVDKNEIIAGSPFKWRSVSEAKDRVVDMTKKWFSSEPYRKIKNENETKNKNAFRVVSSELEDLIEKNREENAHLFIFAARRGLSPITVCDDCETVVCCDECSSPLVLHASREPGKNFFMCHKCGKISGAERNCVNCDGVRLTPLEIGIEKVEQEISLKFKGIDLVKIDADSTKKDKQIASALRKFKEKPGSILIGTEIALSRIRDSIEHVAVSSMDSLFSLPDFRAQEKIMYALVRLRSLSTRSITLQTRKPEEKVLEWGLKGNLSDFYRNTLEERKRFFYPPYSTLIKITIEGKKDRIALKMAEIRKILEPREIDIFPAFTATVRGSSIIHGLMKIPVNEWPEPVLAAKLKSLPPDVSVRIDPETLL